MELTALNIPTNKVTQLQRAGIQQVEDLLDLYPRKYIDRTACTGIQVEGESVFLFQCKSATLKNNKVMLIEAIGSVDGVNLPVYIYWFNQAYLYKDIQATKDKLVLVAGVARYQMADAYGKPNRIEISSPAIYDAAGAAAQKIYPVYKKIPGVAEDYLIRQIQTAAQLIGAPEETLPQDILDRHGLMSHADMVANLHQPASAQMLEQALTRKRWDDLLYFALRIELSSRSVPNGSIYGLPSLGDMNKVRDSLPFQLTAGQSAVLDEAISYIRTGKRLNALLQGDVGCGKTIVAQLLMIAFAGNGYQAAMMAPTQILAKQHYEDLQNLCRPLGIEVAFVGGGKLRKLEQELLEQRIANGKAQLIVGTQALLSENYVFKNLALVVEDEEHKYGVMQRAALTEKAAGGTHTLTMSATPIPRSLAQTIYGDGLQLYSIHEKPAGRKPVLTGIAKTEAKAISFLKTSCGVQGYQAYVVCPMISYSEKMEGVATAEQTYEKYKAALEPDGISVALVTGRTPKTETAQILTAFAEGDISVLVSTTLIEVGVNVPNANCIIIHNAERFGLAQLHQLRGRVGRGDKPSYCSLISTDLNNDRLRAMVQYNDGFMIAQMDLQQRGAGDFLGVQQSGTEKYLALALQHSEEYKQAQAVAKDILDRGESCLLLKKATDDHEEKKSGEIAEK